MIVRSFRRHVTVWHIFTLRKYHFNSKHYSKLVYMFIIVCRSLVILNGHQRSMRGGQPTSISCEVVSPPAYHARWSAHQHLVIEFRIFSSSMAFGYHRRTASIQNKSKVTKSDLDTFRVAVQAMLWLCGMCCGCAGCAVAVQAVL